ncbi:MAG: Spx/MgsR family RNA polymerase-binding regulatory protein [Cardiobacteriaceae bacterium]|nr:Spx/MgsR family RNA polymerase-binding regulatory protein [Cardiobacteriaceae bacterium]
MKLYGIPNCDSVRKAKAILDAHGKSYQFIDLRQSPPEIALLSDWLARFGSTLINKRSTTYREHKQAVITAENAGEDAIIALLQQYPTLIKRPIISDNNDNVWLGLDVPPLQ